MNMSRALARKLTQKPRHWHRLQREKAMRRQTLQNHSSEYAEIINLKKSLARQTDKIHNMRRH